MLEAQPLPHSFFTWNKGQSHYDQIISGTMVPFSKILWGPEHDVGTHTQSAQPTGSELKVCPRAAASGWRQCPPPGEPHLTAASSITQCAICQTLCLSLLTRKGRRANACFSEQSQVSPAHKPAQETQLLPRSGKESLFSFLSTILSKSREKLHSCGALGTLDPSNALLRKRKPETPGPQQATVSSHGMFNPAFIQCIVRYPLLMVKDTSFLLTILI